MPFDSPIPDAHQPVTLIVVAAGKGLRFGGDRPKQYRLLAGKPLLVHTLARLHAHPLIQSIVPVIAPDDTTLWQTLIAPHLDTLPNVRTPVSGGSERQISVRHGLDSLDPHTHTWVAIHDGARPFIDHALLDRLFAARTRADAIVPAIVIHDTVKRIDGMAQVTETLDRTHLRRIQTPQLFRLSALRAAHAHAANTGFTATDDASLMEQAGLTVLTIPGDAQNRKITRPEDLAAPPSLHSTQGSPMDMRIGQGFDVHRFTPDRPLLLGGVHIPHDQGLLGHSDADVLLHAIMDALLGAAALRDIGQHFPDNDPAHRNADSRALLRQVVNLITAHGLMVVNLDATLICEAPRLAAHIPNMITTIAEILQITPDRVNIKATTTEKLGFTGRGEGIAAQAVTLLTRNPT